MGLRKRATDPEYRKQPIRQALDSSLGEKRQRYCTLIRESPLESILWRHLLVCADCRAFFKEGQQYEVKKGEQ